VIPQRRLTPSPGSARLDPGRLIPFGGAPRRDLHAPPDPVQQQIHPRQGVAHLEPVADHLGDPGQRPALILIPPRRGRASRQQHLQLAQLGTGQLALHPTRAPGRQRRPAPSGQRPAPPVRRHPRHPEMPGYLLVAGAGLD